MSLREPQGPARPSLYAARTDHVLAPPTCSFVAQSQCLTKSSLFFVCSAREEIELDSMDVRVLNGVVELRHLRLNCEKINGMPGMNVSSKKHAHSARVLVTRDVSLQCRPRQGTRKGVRDGSTFSLVAFGLGRATSTLARILTF